MRLVLLPTLCLFAHAVHGLRNAALVFVKPHASSDAVDAFVRQHLSGAGIDVVDSGTKAADEINRLKLIDQHYGSLAQLAMETRSADLVLTSAAAEAFEQTFGTPWSEALGATLTNPEAMALLDVDGLTLEALWRGGKDLKLAPGTYIAQLTRPAPDGSPLYTLNGFYPAMRQAFVEPGATIRYLVCEWDEDALSWESFRRDVIGATDPAAAKAGSCRALMLDKWEELGLPDAPSMATNGVHASAGPLEGLKERAVWCGVEVADDPLARELAAAGVGASTLDGWLQDNPTVTLGGEADKVFDLTEEMGAAAVVELCKASRTGAYEYEPAQSIY